MSLPKPLIMFDGLCNLCNGTVDFVIKRDRGLFNFASLQSEHKKLLNLDVPPLESIVLVWRDQVYTNSTAVLMIAGSLTFPWWLLKAFLIIPRPIRDYLYKKIAINRYSWFGKRKQCRVPTAFEKGRILD